MKKEAIKEKFIDPWGTVLPEDYNSLIKDFGLEPFNAALFPKPNKLMRRAVVFAGRDLNTIANCIKTKKDFYVLSGIMPSSSKIHLGNKLVIDNMSYFQGQGAKTYILIADLEAAATRSRNLEESKKDALSYFVPAFIALGLDPKKTVFYFQSQNRAVTRLAYSISNKATINEFRAIYGSFDAPRIMSSVLQVADILYPQLKKRMPGIIPVGPDQDPHIRLTRDIVARTSSYNFVPPSSIYHRFTPDLDGNLKMSKSSQNYISLPESDEEIEKKLKRALTGGRKTSEEQKRLGGQPEKCVIFELYKQHLIEDDKELKNIYDRCKAGKLLCGEDKQNCIKLMKKFMNDFSKKLEAAKKQVSKIHFAEE